MRSLLSSDGNSRTWRAGLPTRAVGSVADQRTAPVRASSARRPISVWTTIMSGPAWSTSSAVASDAAVTRRCIRPPSPFLGASVCWNRASLAQRWSPVARSYSATTGGPAARRPWTSNVPLCGSTRRVTTCARLKRRESNTTAPVTGSKTISRPGRAASMSREPSTTRTLSAGKPASSGFSHVTWPRSMSTPASSASVELRSAPAGVTCCQRTSHFVLMVHDAVAPAGATVCAYEVADTATTRESERSVRRGVRTSMAILRWPPISPHGEAARKPGWLSPIEGRQIGARERLFAAALSRLRPGLQAAAPRRGRGAGRLAARGSGQATSLRARVPALAAPVSLRRHRAPRPRPRDHRTPDDRAAVHAFHHRSGPAQNGARHRVPARAAAAGGWGVRRRGDPLQRDRRAAGLSPALAERPRHPVPLDGRRGDDDRLAADGARVTARVAHPSCRRRHGAAGPELAAGADGNGRRSRGAVDQFHGGAAHPADLPLAAAGRGAHRRPGGRNVLGNSHRAGVPAGAPGAAQLHARAAHGAPQGAVRASPGAGAVDVLGPDAGGRERGDRLVRRVHEHHRRRLDR